MMIIFVVDSVRGIRRKSRLNFRKNSRLVYVCFAQNRRGDLTDRLRCSRRAYTQYSPVGSKPIVAAAVKKIFKKNFFL